MACAGFDNYFAQHVHFFVISSMSLSILGHMVCLALIILVCIHFSDEMML